MKTLNKKVNLNAKMVFKFKKNATSNALISSDPTTVTVTVLTNATSV